MVTNRLCSAIFNGFSQPCEVTTVLDDIMFGAAIDMLSDDIEIIVMTIPAVTLEFVVVGAAYAVDVLTVLIIEVVPAIDIDMLADENTNGFAAVMTPLEFTLPAPSEESMPLC